MIYCMKVYPFDYAIQEVFPLKYWRGFICAAIFAALTWALTSFAEAHGSLVDMLYPYTTRLIQSSLADWTASVPFCLWQVLVVLLGIIVLASIVLMVILRWNFVQWTGWVLAVCSIFYCLHTGIYGLNYYAGSIAEDIRLEKTEYIVTEMAEATTYYMEMANSLSTQVPRNYDGTLNYPTFEELAEKAAEGFTTLTYRDHTAIFSGSTVPVKQLGWADLYTSMGITGIHMPVTGEAAVNPQIPVVSLPFTMCHEMCHRTCIAQEGDANMGAFLACRENSDPIFQYSGYFMAFRYCYYALLNQGSSSAKAAANDIYAKIGPQMRQDLTDYDAFFAANQDETATNIANTANDTYIKLSGDDSGISAYGEVSDLLFCWYIQEIYLPLHQDEIIVFDPTDKNQVDLSENVG